MSRTVEQLMNRWERKRSQRKVNRELLAASPRLREEYLAAMRGSDS